MTQEQIKFMCNKAHEITTEIWGTEHMSCFGNLELKMQEVVKNLTIPAVMPSLPLSKCCGFEQKITEIQCSRCLTKYRQ